MSDAGRLADRLAVSLRSGGAVSVRELVAQARAAGIRRAPRSLVERTLRDDPRFVPDGDPGKARWRLAETPLAPAGSAAPAEGTRQRLDELGLLPWQAEALAAWSATCRGVVEAVTGTGKTRLAMAAIRTVIDRGGRALVLVPTLELQDQWVRELRSLVAGVRVGRLGGGHDDDLFGADVLVATPHSAAAVPIDLPPGAAGLLVADEAHRYGAPTWGGALHEVFALRLALTATYERGDDGLVEVLEPYFGGIVFTYGYGRAVAEGTVAPFRIALAGIRLTPRERESYDLADARARQLHGELVGGLKLPRDPRELFAAVAGIVAESDRSGRDGTQVRACREYLVRIRERREVAASATGKLEVCRRLGPALVGRRTLVFTDTVEQAEAAARVLHAAGLTAETVHGGLTRDRRRIRLARFRAGRLDVVVAPRVLDEGVDVPDADVAVVLAAFRTRRQLVQRLGRVLRRKADGRCAQLVLAHAVDTAEDPARGGHRDFLDEVRGVARGIEQIDLDRAPGALAGWLLRG